MPDAVAQALGDRSTPSVFERLAEGEPPAVAAEPVSIVIFGGAGDLAHRKLLPALYNLSVDGLLPPRTAIVAVGRKLMTDDEYRAFAKDGITQFSRRPIDDAAWDTFAGSLFFVNATIDDDQSLGPLGSKLVLFFIQYATMRAVILHRRRRKAQQAMIAIEAQPA